MFWNRLKHWAPEIILLSLVGFLQFFRLGIGEIQSWDEALYIIRAEACLRFGVWIDQAQYAIGGIYSSTHPPLVVWMMAIARYFGGNSVFVSRIIAAIAGIVGLFFFYKLAGKFFSRWTRLIITICLGSAQGYLHFSHRGQFDIPMFAFITASVYYAVRSFEENDWKLAAIAGLMFGSALMSKAAQGLYLLPFLTALPYVFRSTNWKKHILIILGVAAAVALPWYVFMMLKHPQFYGDFAAMLSSMKTGTFTNRVATQWWYYLNQIFIEFPLLILGVMVIPQITRRFKTGDSIYNRFLLISFAWLFGMLIFLSSFQIKMAQYSMHLLLPTSLILSYIIEEFLQYPPKIGRSVLSLGLLGFSIAWSSSETVRKAIREHHVASLHPSLILIAGLVLLTVILAVFIRGKLRIYGQVALLFGAAILLVLVEFYQWANLENASYVDGAEQVGNVLLHTSEIHSLTAYHEDFPHEIYLPQLNYYSNSWFLGWDPSKFGQTKTWDELDSLIKIDAVPRSDAAIIYVSWDEVNMPILDTGGRLTRLNQGLAVHYAKALHTKKYQLYWDPK